MREFVHKIGSLTWEDCEPPVDDEVIEGLERSLDVKFPSDFREVMQLCHGGNPVERCDFYYDNPTLGRPIRSGIGALMTLYPDDTGGILTTLRLLAMDDQLPDKIVPFAEGGGGDMMCLDYRTDPDHPGVVYWAHEEEKESAIIPLADSFSEFLDKLLPPKLPPPTR